MYKLAHTAAEIGAILRCGIQVLWSNLPCSSINNVQISRTDFVHSYNVSSLSHKQASKMRVNIPPSME